MAEPLTTTTILLLSVTIFTVGFLVGWATSNQKDVTPKKKLRVLLAAVITLAWLSATLAGIVIASYTVSPLLHALMGAIVGYFFTDDGITFNVGGS